jgi:hypothetical protein
MIRGSRGKAPSSTKLLKGWEGGVGGGQGATAPWPSPHIIFYKGVTKQWN